MKVAYLARFVFQILIENQTSAQFDIQYRLIEAEHFEQAKAFAIAIGKQEECFISNDSGQQLEWKFIQISDWFPLHQATNGSQILSETLEVEDKKLFLHWLHHKAEANVHGGI